LNQIKRKNQHLEIVSNSNKFVDHSHLKIEKAIVLPNLRENNSLVDTIVKNSHQSQALCLDENRSVTSIEAESVSKFIYDKETNGRSEKEILTEDVETIGEKQEVKVFRSSIQMNQLKRKNQLLDTVFNSNKFGETIAFSIFK